MASHDKMLVSSTLTMTHLQTQSGIHPPRFIRTGVKVGIAWLSQLCETQVSQQIEGM